MFVEGFLQPISFENHFVKAAKPLSAPVFAGTAGLCFSKPHTQVQKV
jgi:hypothetical protein